MYYTISIISKSVYHMNENDDLLDLYKNATSKNNTSLPDMLLLDRKLSKN